MHMNSYVKCIGSSKLYMYICTVYLYIVNIYVSITQLSNIPQCSLNLPAMHALHLCYYI